jgi:hypothetical protein
VNPHPNSSNSGDTAVVIATPKGTCLAEWTPYLITRLYLNESDDGVFEDPTFMFGLSSLVRWNDCFIWRQQQPQQQKSMLWKTTKLQRFLKHARQTFLPVSTTTRTISSDSLSIWKLLCLLITLQVIDHFFPSRRSTQERSSKNWVPSCLSHCCMSSLWTTFLNDEGMQRNEWVKGWRKKQDNS